MINRRLVGHILLLLLIVLLFPSLRFLRGMLVSKLVDLVLPLFVLGAGLFLTCGAVFPIQGWRMHWRVFLLLVGWYLGRNRPCFVVRDGRDEERIPGSPLVGRVGIGIILVDSSSVVVLERGSSRSRVIGPGVSFLVSDGEPLPDGWDNEWSVIFTERFEKIRGVIDLRRQRRRRRVHAVTRDGIEVSVVLDVDFMLEPGKWVGWDTPYQFTREAACKAVYGEAIDEEETETYDWAEGVAVRAADELRHILSEYTLDQLYSTIDMDRDPQLGIQRALNEKLSSIAASKGARLLGTTLGVIRVPEEVIKQRVTNWQAEWIRRQTIIEAQGEAEAKQRMEVARALAQLEMIQSITEGLQEAQVAGAPMTSDLISLRLLEALEKLAHEAEAQSMITGRGLRQFEAMLQAAYVEGEQVPWEQV